MIPWIVFAPTHDDRADLDEAHWIATLHQHLPTPPAEFVARDEATRSALDLAVQKVGQPCGVALFGHGTDEAVFGADDQPAFDQHNARAEWVHAFACNTGRGLAERCAGVQRFAGYTVSLLVGWEHGALPEALRMLMSELFVTVTRALVRGERSRRALKAEVSRAADDLMDWLNANAPDDFHQVAILASMLVDRLVFVGEGTTA